MEIEFVNHASFLVRSGGVRLLVDPWFEGTVFNGGWSLLSPTRHRWEDLADVTHLWLSHEHPDHFNTRTLGAIPADLRARVEVLYQRTVDRKIVDWCSRIGFRSVRQLEPHAPWALAADFQVTCGPMHPGDSWLRVCTPDATLLNLNDCEIDTREQARAIRGLVGSPDVLCTQFSIAAWGGNADDPERRRARSRFMLDRMRMQCEVFEPRFLMPFASFVWFCHEENRFMNEGVNRIDAVVAYLRENVEPQPIVLYPCDRWRVGEPMRPEPALERYARDYADCAARPAVSSPTVSEDELVDASRLFVEKLRSHGGRRRMRLRLALKHYRRRRAALTRPTLRDRLGLAGILLLQRVEPSRIYVTDLKRSYLFDLDRALRPCTLPMEECDVWLASDSLHYSFNHLWGGDTLQINGRFREVRPESRLNLFQDFWLAKGLNAGDPLTWTGLLRSGRRRLRL